MKRDVALALLGLSDSNPTDAEVNAAYKAAMQLNHPDRYASNERLRKHAEEQSKLINEAREVLLNGTWEREVGNDGKSQVVNSSEESWNRDPFDFGDEFGARGREARNDSNRSNYSSPSNQPPSPTRKTALGLGKGKLAVAIVAIALIALVMIPAEIEPSKETVRSMQEQGEAVSVNLVAKREGSATFTVASSTGDFDVDVDVSLPSDVGIGSEGYVCCESGALRFDGHDEREYVFLLPRQGNLIQGILANHGLADGCYSLPGRIEEEKDMLFVSTSEEFSANFPCKPQVSDSSEGVATIRDFTSFSLKSKHFTVARYVESPNVIDAFFSEGEDVAYANLSGIVVQTLDSYSSGEEMTPEADAYELSYGEEDGCLLVSTIAPFAMPVDSSSDVSRHVYMYVLTMADGARWYTLVGLRDTYEEAEEALSSFHPRGEGLLWGY